MTKNETEGGISLMPIIVGVAVLAVAAFVLFGQGGSPSGAATCPVGSTDCNGGGTTPVETVVSNTPSGSEPAAEPDPETTYIPISDVDDGTAHFYEYDYNGKTIKYFVLKSSDGILRAAFDACDVCYASKLGYRQEGDNMVCNNCGQKFPSNRINLEKGGCNPAPLDRSMEGSEHEPVALESWASDGFVAIKNSDIESGARYF